MSRPDATDADAEDPGRWPSPDGEGPRGGGVGDGVPVAGAMFATKAATLAVSTFPASVKNLVRSSGSVIAASRSSSCSSGTRPYSSERK
jgi:hypothetical protein